MISAQRFTKKFSESFWYHGFLSRLIAQQEEQQATGK